MIIRLKKFMKQLDVPKVLFIVLPVIIFIRCGADTSQLWSLQRMMDALQANDSAGVLAYLPFVLVAIVLETGMGILSGMLVSYGVFKGAEKVRTMIAKKLVTCDYLTLLKKNMGQLMTRIFRDGDVSFKLPSVFFNNVLYSSILLLFSLVLAFYANWFMAILCIVMIPPIVGLSSVLSKKIRAAAAAAKTSDDNASLWYQEMLEQIPVTMSFHTETQWVKKINEESEKQTQASERQIRAESGYQPFLMLARFLPQDFILIIGAWLVSQQKMTLGTLFLFESLYEFISNGLSDIPDWIAKLKVTDVSVDRVQELLDLPMPAKVAADGSPLAQEQIALAQVQFRYPDSSFQIDELSLTIPEGARVALVGESGSGKSSLLKLVAGLIRPNSGSEDVLGYDPSHGENEQFYRQLAFLMQDTFLFPGTIAENLQLGDDSLSEEELWTACEKAHIKDWICTLPDGLQTDLKQFAANISGGQKQRLGIARAILKKPKLWLLDEPTSSLDRDTGIQITRELQTTLAGSTSIMATHQLYEMEAYDRIYYMEQGKICESGSHQDLMHENGGYARLYRTANGLDFPEVELALQLNDSDS